MFYLLFSTTSFWGFSNKETLFLPLAEQTYQQCGRDHTHMRFCFLMLWTQIGSSWFWHVSHAIDFPLYPFIGNTKPTITPAGSHLVVPLNAPFELRCQGEKEMQWQREDRPKVRGEIKITGMSTVRISRAQPAHMGRYICLEEMSKAQTSIYVYVKGRRM